MPVFTRISAQCLDPCGIGDSTSVQCFASEDEGKKFLASVPQGFPIGTTEINTWNQAYKHYSQLCKQRSGDLLNHVSTAEIASENSIMMARTLSSARLLTVDGYGHTALLNPSQCAKDYMAAYFTSGALPPDKAVCKQDKPPFHSSSPP